MPSMKKFILLFLAFTSLGHAASATQPLTELTNANFDQAVGNSPLAIVDFNAKWCGASARFRNVLLDFSQDNPTVDVYSVDVDAEPALAAAFNVRVYPTTYVFRYGRQVYGFSGVGTEQFLADKINSHR